MFSNFHLFLLQNVLSQSLQVLAGGRQKQGCFSPHQVHLSLFGALRSQKEIPAIDKDRE